MADHDHTPLIFPSGPGLLSSSSLAVEHDLHDELPVFDSITDMFLGPATEPVPEQSLAPWRVELLLMGHLPVRARPWASQYAAAIAAREGARVALVRIGGGYGSVELFGSAKGTLSVAAAPSLAGAIERARELASLCIVQLEEDAYPDLITRGLVQGVTLLVGGNSAAVVDGYRVVKRLSSEVGARLPALRIGVMGATRDDADAACTKLREASEQFLDQPIDESIAIERMGPTGAVSLYGDRASHTPHQAIGMVIGEPIEHLDSEFAAETPLDTETRSTRQESLDRQPLAEPKLRTPRLDLSAMFSTDPRPSLTAFVRGVEPLDLSCPYDNETSLGVDAEGGLHILRHADDEGEALLMALDWGEAHRHLLSRATNGLIRVDRDVVAHAFVREAREGCRLRSALGDRVQVHTLIEVPEGTRWVGLDL